MHFTLWKSKAVLFDTVQVVAQQEKNRILQSLSSANLLKSCRIVSRDKFEKLLCLDLIILEDGMRF